MPFSSFPTGDQPVTRFIAEIEHYHELLTTTNADLDDHDRAQLLAFAEEIARQPTVRRLVLVKHFKERLDGLIGSEFQEQVWTALVRPE